MRAHTTALLAAAAVTAVLATASCTDATGARPIRDAVVERVIDGDTVVISFGGRSEDVRLIGVDTPETVKPHHPVECHGHEASAYTASVLPPGTRVRVERDVEARDDYGRLLAYVHRADDGLFVNLALAELGHARPLRIPPNTAHTADIAAATRRAQQSRAGLWGACSG